MLRRSLRSLLLAALLVLSQSGRAQTAILKGTVYDSSSHEGLAGARIAIKGTTLGAIADDDGHYVLYNAPLGTHIVTVTSYGHEPQSLELRIAQGSDSITLNVALLPIETEGEEVVVSGTRTERSISDVPVRVEAIPQEEVEEKLMMRPASVAMLLNETAGIRVQNTSGTSNTANIRIQGLDGRYTLVLVDGIPSFSGMAAGFGITQLMPLNLRQVEIVKGASSALYGADAISGIVNFITKEPREETEVTGVVNITSQQGLDLSGYYGERFDQLGLTGLVSFNRQSKHDVNDDNFSDLAEYTRFTFSPKLLYQFSDAVRAKATATYFHENRLGGVMDAPASAVGRGAPYLESNISERLNFTSSLDWRAGTAGALSARVAGMRLTRDGFYGATPFDGVQTFNFNDAQFSTITGMHSILLGASASSERFEDKTPNVIESRSYTYSDIGGWIQDECSLGNEWKAIASGRVDHNNPYGTFFTPRASLMYRPTPLLTLRIGGGSAFKAPTIFLEEAELYGFRNTRPIRNATVEQARSASFDINYKAVIGELAARINLAVYTTRLDNALIVDEDSLRSNIISIVNSNGPTISTGGECTAQLSLSDFRLSVSYAYLNAEQTNNGLTKQLELDPHHWIGIVLMFENADYGIKAGIENYYTSSQRLEHNPYRSSSPPYWLNGFMVEKSFGSLHVFLNAENVFDVRQTRFEPTFLGNPAQGDFRPLHIYAPLEGRSFNGGIRFVL